MKITIFSAYLLVAISFSASAQAATVVAYIPVNGASNSPSVVGSGVTGNDLTRGSGLVENVGGPLGTFNSRSWDVGTPDVATAIANNDFLLWGFTSATPYNLTTLDIRYDRSPTGPTMLEVGINVNNAGFSTIFSDASVSDSGEEHPGIDLSAYTSVTSAVFRLVAFGSTNLLGTFDIESTSNFDGANGLVVSGVATPLPAALPLFATGLGGLGLLAWRRKRKAAAAIAA